MGHSIATIGYEGSSIEHFIATLRHASVDVLIDVRDLPLSRKKGFSKRRLAETLADYGIEYVHLRGLGNPKAGRNAARAGKFQLFQTIFGRKMRTEAALHDLNVATKLVSARRACLMCFECNHAECHRSIVADQLAKITRLTVTPLIVHDVAVLAESRPHPVAPLTLCANSKAPPKLSFSSKPRRKLARNTARRFAAPA
jgi:uncharacterized protein (DUF488 family)